MLNARNAIVAAVLLAVLSIAAAIWDVARPPENSGRGKNSYGTKAHGNKALFEILTELGLSVDRSLLPPSALLKHRICIGLVSPINEVVQTEPEYLWRIGQWVEEEGGHVVVALEVGETLEAREYDSYYYDEQLSVLEALGLPGQQPVAIQTTATALKEEKELRERRAKLGLWKIGEIRERGSIRVSGYGSFAMGDSSPARVYLPSEELQVLDHNTTAPVPADRLVLRSNDDVEYTLAAKFPVGKGSISVITDAALLLNDSIALDDNAVLAYQLFSAPRLPIVMDEFYHGLNQRGNPFWLLTRPNYGFVLAMMVLAMTLWMWKHSGTFGPPMPEAKVDRRNLNEYIMAMGNLFHRAKARRFVLEELQNGVLWTLAHRLQLPPGKHALPDIMPILQRKDPDTAAKLEKATRLVEQLMQEKHATEKQVEQAAKELSECL